MNALRWRRMKGLYFDALDQPEDARDAFLEQACDGDAELLAELRRLLTVQDRVGRFLEPTGASLEHLDVGRLERPRAAVTRLGDFELLEEIGSGSMGVVYRARQRSLDRHVAVKVLQPALTLSHSQVERFRLEATAAARLQHPAIVAVHSVGSEGEVHYYAMDLIEGPSLEDLLCGVRHRAAAGLGAEDLLGGATSYSARVAEIGAELAAGLQASHDARILHRDIKPANVLLDADGSAHLTDFGLAQDLDLEALVRTGQVAGTPYYMSPEQAARRSVELDPRSDVFSLGVVLYELLTLRRPFDGESCQEVLNAIRERVPTPVRRLNPRVPKDLETIVHKALEKRPDQRFATARELGLDLRRFLSHESIRARPPTLVARAQRLLHRHRVATAGVALLVAAFLVGGWWDRRGRHEVLAAEVSRLSQSLAERAPAAVLAERREGVRALANVLDVQSPSLSAVEERLAERGEGLLRGGLDELFEGVAHPGRANPERLLAGLEHVAMALRLAGPAGPEVIAGELEGWSPRLTVEDLPAGARVSWADLDPLTGRTGEFHDLGVAPLVDVPVRPGYLRLRAAHPGLGHAERSIVVRELGVRRTVSMPVRPTEEVVRDMVLVPGGDFVWGAGTPGNSPFPLRDDTLPSFWIDRTEVRNADYAAFLAATGRPAPRHWTEWTGDGTLPPGWEDLPATGMDYYDAEAYAAWVGKRLPTLPEWERAMRGTRGFMVPWAEEDDPTRYAVLGHTLERPPMGTPEEIARHERETYLRLVRRVDDLPAGATPEGILHGLGNVSEWTEGFFPQQLEDGTWIPGSDRTTKGGNAATRPRFGLGATVPMPTDQLSVFVGFRCAKGLRP